MIVAGVCVSATLQIGNHGQLREVPIGIDRSHRGAEAG